MRLHSIRLKALGCALPETSPALFQTFPMQLSSLPLPAQVVQCKMHHGPEVDKMRKTCSRLCTRWYNSESCCLQTRQSCQIFFASDIHQQDPSGAHLQIPKAADIHHIPVLYPQENFPVCHQCQSDVAAELVGSIGF